MLVKQAIRGAYKLPLFEMVRLSPRLIDLVPVKPIRAVINVTHKCNSKCITCYHWKENSHDELSLIEITDILYQLKKAGIIDLCISGGEPLLRDDLNDIVRTARSLKFDRISVITNGLLINKENVEHLVHNGLNSISVSLNGNEYIHDMTRGIKGAFTKTMTAIETMAEMRDYKFPGLEINVLTIVMGMTVDQIINVVNICRKFSVGCSFSPISASQPWRSDVAAELMEINQDRLDDLIDELHHIKKSSHALCLNSHTSLEYIRGYFTGRKPGNIPCYLGFLVVGIGPHGELFSGCWSLPPVGNLTQTPLKQIIKSKNYRERIHQMFLRNCPGCTCDYALNLYAHTPAIFEEVGWMISHTQSPK